MELNKNSKEYKKLQRHAVKIFVEYALDAVIRDWNSTKVINNDIWHEHLAPFADTIVEERQELELGRPLDLNIDKEEDMYYDWFNEAQDMGNELIESIIDTIENKNGARIAELILQADKLSEENKMEDKYKRNDIIRHKKDGGKAVITSVDFKENKYHYYIIADNFGVRHRSASFEFVHKTFDYVETAILEYNTKVRNEETRENYWIHEINFDKDIVSLSTEEIQSRGLNEVPEWRELKKKPEWITSLFNEYHFTTIYQPRVKGE